MTAPLTPQDCDLRDFQFMPLDVVKLRDSDLCALEEPEACWAAVQLWCAAWHQVPAGSLPDDDRVLAQLAGYGRVVKEWMKVRDGALRNFLKCDDGRLYHPVVSEKAREAWLGKLRRMWATECARIKKQNQRNQTELPAPTLDEFLATRVIVPRDGAAMSPGTQENVPGDNGACPDDVPREMASIGTGKGKGTGKDTSEDKSSAGRSGFPDPDKLAWSEATILLTQDGEMSDSAARSFFGKLLSTNGLRAKELLTSVTAAMVNGTRDPRAYLTKAASGISKRQGAPAQQAEWC